MTTSAAAITNSTGGHDDVGGRDPRIGYISLGSLDDTVKAVSIDGVAPTAAAVRTAPMPSRVPFNIVTKGRNSPRRPPTSSRSS